MNQELVTINKETNKKIVEVNGIKMEIDMRFAREITEYRVGDRVKVLVKEYSDYKSYPGMIVGFENFKERPSIVIVYLKMIYGDADLHFVFLNKDTKDIEVCPMTEDYISINKSSILEKMDKEIFKKQEEIKDLQMKREYFLNNFNKYFNE